MLSQKPIEHPESARALACARSLVSRHHLLSVLLFILFVKLLYWSCALVVAHRVPLIPARYFWSGHHYQIEPRITQRRVDFLSLWIYEDSEWYLSIAERGYPNTQEIKQAALAKRARTGYPYPLVPGSTLARVAKYTEWDADAKYAFFPLYPLVIAAFHLFLPLHLAAFVATNLISALAFLALYGLALEYVPDKGLAFRSLLLLAFYPFSVFYQAYFTEGLLLLLAVSSLYFLKKKRLGLSVLCGALLCMTKAIGVVIAIPLVILAIKQSPRVEGRAVRRAKQLGRRTKTMRIDWRACTIAALTPLGLAPFMLLNYFKTGHWNYFALAEHRWGYETSNLLENALTNIFVTGSKFFDMKWLTDHDSRIDYAALIFFLAIIVLSYKRLPLELWSFSLLLWLVPVVTKDLMSFSRYMSVSFPSFMYLAGIRRKLVFGILAVGFLIGSLVIDGMMTTWRWIG
jgi:hypothetical protein